MGPLARHVLAWEVVDLAAVSSPPALSESSESRVRSDDRKFIYFVSILQNTVVPVSSSTSLLTTVETHIVPL